jgi:hypothetical protein
MRIVVSLAAILAAFSCAAVAIASKWHLATDPQGDDDSETLIGQGPYIAMRYAS